MESSVSWHARWEEWDEWEEAWMKCVRGSRLLSCVKYCRILNLMRQSTGRSQCEVVGRTAGKPDRTTYQVLGGQVMIYIECHSAVIFMIEWCVSLDWRLAVNRYSGCELDIVKSGWLWELLSTWSCCLGHRRLRGNSRSSDDANSQSWLSRRATDTGKLSHLQSRRCEPDEL